MFPWLKAKEIEMLQSFPDGGKAHFPPKFPFQLKGLQSYQRAAGTQGFACFLKAKAVPGADKLKYEKSLISMIYTMFLRGWASPRETKIDESTVPDLFSFGT